MEDSGVSKLMWGFLVTEERGVVERVESREIQWYCSIAYFFSYIPINLHSGKEQPLLHERFVDSILMGSDERPSTVFLSLMGPVTCHKSEAALRDEYCSLCHRIF